ncbi:MAG: hypothetical protein ACETWK_07685 [Candidatus Aminicenantaceae bacterium]
MKKNRVENGAFRMKKTIDLSHVRDIGAIIRLENRLNPKRSDTPSRSKS